MNPFSMPPEAEFFWLHNTDHRKSEVEHPPDAKVWEKSTCASRYGSTKALREEDLPVVELPAKKLIALEEETPDDAFLTTIATKPSVGLLDPLKYTEKDIRNYVQKKRDVFLLQMALDVKQAEIVRLDEKAKKKEEALTKSQQILDDDARKFEEFLHSKYAQGQATMKNAEEQSKKKQEKLAQCKQLRRDIAGMQSEIGKLTEYRRECMRYKTFLEKLTPTEWKEQQKELKLVRKARRRENAIAESMKGVVARLAEEERAQERADEEKHEESKRKPGGRRPRKQEVEEERLRLEKERNARRKRMLKRQKEEEQRLANAYVEVSSEEEAELHFKESSQLMATFTELEEKNLFLIQSSQEKEQQLDEFQLKFEITKKDLENKVTQLKDNIKQLDHSINQEKRRGDELRRSYEEKASMQAQEEKLGDLFAKVQNVYLRCGLSMDHDPDTLQMLASIEARLEELIHGLEEAYLRDSRQVKQLELQKQKERRERLREQKIQDSLVKQEERLKISLQRSQNPVFKKAGKQVMYRSPPLRQEKRVVRDTSEDEANARDHRVFDIYIDRKGLPQAEAPVIEDPRKALSSRVVALRAAAAEKAHEDKMADETKLGIVADSMDTV
eukprot:CAMPEP_0169107950 /NCGR_PEP_ID=MMETSP1015-20121227/25165_1 /TAXON_ID=342587 /ORGANISM="Karlodinium micrum, Strain CCMP2283" /LENGTH=614 /DNA_ID=CAMNT_0009169535 /DNA_START=117 /DNA_END=1961 /DNA_ORIENTATION=+